MSHEALLEDPAFSSFGFIPRDRLAGLYGNSVFSLTPHAFAVFDFIVTVSGLCKDSSPPIHRWVN